jgi:hypothetical protein
MWTQFRWHWFNVTCLVIVVLLTAQMIGARLGRVPLRYLDIVQNDIHLLDLPALARWEKDRREIGFALSPSEMSSPVRCVLRIKPGTAAQKEPELEVELNNTSDDPVFLHIHQYLLDVVTFVLRDSHDVVASSFCYIMLHSDSRPKPPVTLKPGESKTAEVYLSVVTGHGFQPLRPGLYSLQAVFAQPFMHSRSNRLSVHVEETVDGLSLHVEDVFFAP